MRSGSTKVFGCLADLPIAIGEGMVDCRLGFIGGERREGEDRPSTDRRGVVAAVQNRRKSPVVADRAKRGDRRLADQRNICVDGERDEPVQHRVVNDLVLAVGPRHLLDDGGIGIVEQRDEVEMRSRRRKVRGAAADRGDLIAQRAPQLVVVKVAATFERTEGELAYHRIEVGPPGAGHIDLAERARRSHVAPAFVHGCPVIGEVWW